MADHGKHPPTQKYPAQAWGGGPAVPPKAKRPADQPARAKVRPKINPMAEQLKNMRALFGKKE